MKTLIVHEEEHQADKIVKNEEKKYIIGSYYDGGVVFLFRGVNDFNAFSLKEGEEWDEE